MASVLCNKTCAVSSTLSRRQPLQPSPQPHSHSLPARTKSSLGARLAFQNSALHGLTISSTATTHLSSNSPPQRSPTTAPVSAKLVKFTGRKEVSIPFQENSLPPGEYLKETERIVNVTFPDSARIKYLGDSVWQARLLTITFFQFSATPSTDVRVVHENGVLIIDSTRLILDVTGLPEQFRNMNLQFTLHGELRVYPRTNGSPTSAPRMWDFGGWVNISVGANLPLPLSLIPERLLTGVGNQVVARILGAMEGALLQGIIDDYNAWCASPNPQAQAVPASGKQ
ncbi:hypothetical protein KC19_2G080800 [Ceratodon purpureus]|uniref:Uncharacterized protein n=1 Tax=Ceratodon purpureus TaxID=3225 RepID=A0A8T0ITH2_CERPU|nr:hypothetical protein KC19_2G080300 [Ceratodon purpureus]KAG0586304.1 hypothetical protein KC19_2G080800 [Ceratodon purpureus]